VIALLRDPVARAHSNYWDRKAFGTEDLGWFEDALAAEPDRMATVDKDRLLYDPRYYSFHHDHHSYRARGETPNNCDRGSTTFRRTGCWCFPPRTCSANPAGRSRPSSVSSNIPIAGTIPLRRYNERSVPRLDPATQAVLAEY